MKSIIEHTIFGLCMLTTVALMCHAAHAGTAAVIEFPYSVAAESTGHAVVAIRGTVTNWV